jgi:hypothetical protein
LRRGPNDAVFPLAADSWQRSYHVAGREEYWPSVETCLRTTQLPKARGNYLTNQGQITNNDAMTINADKGNAVTILKGTETPITNKCTKTVLSSIVTHSYIFRPCWVIFRENFLLSLH